MTDSSALAKTREDAATALREILDRETERRARESPGLRKEQGE